MKGDLLYATMINSTESVLKQSLYNTINNFGLKLDKAFIVLDNKLNLIYQNEKHVKLTGFSCDEINQILEKVLIWMQQRHYEGKKIIPVAVNISADHFYQPNFVSDLKSLINKYYADPKMIVIEITESLGLEEIKQAQHIINELSVFGFQVSVDDFGMGYSSLSYLQKLNFKELKIDMSFVRRLDEVATKAIVQSIIHIAKYLEMRVVAEGVETEQQAAILKELQCDVVQGYLYNKPIPLSDIDL